MNQKLRVVVTLVVGFALIFGLWLFARTITSLTGYSIGATRFDNFAKCLTEKGAVLYTSDSECESCIQQKAIFKSSYQYLNIVNCRVESEKCNALDIKYAPVWIIGDRKYFGLHGVPRLAEITGCGI